MILYRHHPGIHWFGTIYDMILTTMNFYEFLDLDDRGKAFAVWHYGVYLLSRTVDDLTYKLYAIEDFYVEISQSKDDKLVEAMNSFESV